MPVASRPSGTWPRERWAWVSMALGAGILWFSCQWLYFGLVSRWWTTTTGTVTYSSAHESRRYRSVDIRYKYAVDGLEYEGDRFRYGYTTALGRLTSIEVSAAQAAYPVGSHPRVYVDPRHPARSVLEPRAPVEDLIWVGGGLMFLLTPFVRTGRSPAPAPDPAAAAASTGAFGATTGAGATDAAVPTRGGRPTDVAGPPRHRAAKVLAWLGILTLGLGAYRIELVMRAKHWPTTPGHVLFSKITVGTSSGGNHQTEVRYEYVLDGQRYVGSASLVAGLDEARALMRAYPAGSDVTVHYDPARHERSLLVTQLNWHHAVLPVFAVVFLVLAALARTMGRARGRARA
jgi:hypothetical protein